ncbi:MAG: UbiA family prenyltransferase, partial [Halobacteriales archaeon]|nr:UbiA family prenyltransferase [Halobacteriales archaeon]
MSHETGRQTTEVDRTDSPYESLVEWLTVYGERAGDAVVYSSAYLGVIAMVQVAIVMVLLSVPPNPAPVVVGLVVFAVYANDRIVDVDTDVVTAPKQASFVRRYRGELYVLAAASYGFAVALSAIGGPSALAITVIPGVLWVFYAREWTPTIGPHIRRLKELLLVNSIVVALGWSLALTFLPLAYGGTVADPVVAVIFAYYFLGTFANTELPNVFDMEADAAIGVSTLPLAVGVDRTRQLLYGIDLLVAAVVGAAVLVDVLPLLFAAPLLAGVGYSLCVTGCLGRVKNGRVLTIAA